jgi:excisionase family DNA binding protein
MRQTGCMRQTASRPQLLTVAQAASLLNVSEKTIRRWVDDEKIPYLRLPSRQIRIPLAALLASLQGNYDLAGEVAELDARFVGVTEDAIRAASGES